MKQIKLNVQDDKVEIVLNILNNLKDGLISNVEISEINLTSQTQYKPILNKIIDENEKPHGKYLSPKAYKAKFEKR